MAPPTRDSGGSKQMLEILWILVLGALLLVILWKVLPIRHVIVYEYQKGLKYTNGRYAGTLKPGQYWILSTFSSIAPVDVRPEFITIQGQDVLSADGVTLKISLAAEFQIVDPHIAVNKNANARNSLYLSLQMALREIVGKEKIDILLENRAGFSSKLMELTSGKASEWGLKLISADVKDIMFPGEMKKAFAQVIKAQKEGQAALERARGETAALRSLANAARIMDDNPNLLQLRALQSLADSSGNTLVLGLPNGALPLARQNEKNVPSQRKEKKEPDED
jgi:regulator of protease activity HflC (stomatin/prohibitin superfamily)